MISMGDDSVVDFIGGRVEFLNYGYEFDESFEFKGFIAAENSDSLTLKYVNFSYNTVYNGRLIYMG